MGDFVKERPDLGAPALPDTMESSAEKRSMLARPRRIVRRFPVAAVVVSLLLGAGLAGMPATAQQDKAAAISKDLAKKLAAAKSDLSAAQAARDTLSAEKAQLTTTLSQLEDKIKKLQAAIPLPNFGGKTLDAVRPVIDEHGWVLATKTVPSARPEGTIIGQSPAAGQMMKFGATVTLSIAAPLPPSWKSIYTFRGRGERKTGMMHLPDVEAGKLRIVYKFTGGTNAQLTLYAPPDDHVEGYLNEIGNYSDTTFLYYSGDYYFEICCGSWSVDVQVFK